MELCKDEMRSGHIWFFVAGTIAVCLVIFLYKMDTTITTYHNENRIEVADTINELREAQHALGTAAVDPRTQN